MAEAKFKIGDEVVLIAQYPDGDNCHFNMGWLKVGQTYVVGDIGESHCSWNPSGVYYTMGSTGCIVDESMIVLSDKHKNPLDNTKIDVQGYAKQYGLSLEEAHKEIQPWLFEQGYVWFKERNYMMATLSKYLFLFENRISWDSSLNYFSAKSNKQIFLERNVNIVLTIKPEIATIEIEGKKYNKQDVFKLLSQLETVE